MIKRFTRHILLLLILTMIVLPLEVLADDLTSPATNLSASITGSSHTLGKAYSGSASEGTAEMKVTSLRSVMNGTLKLTNNGSEAAVLSFSYSISGNYDAFKIDSTTVSASGVYSKELAVGASTEIYVTATSYKSATVKLTNVKLVVPQDANVTFSYNGGGTVSVGGTTVTSGTTVTVPAAGTTITASPASGNTFLGWVNTADDSVVSSVASYTYKPEGDISLKAVFVGPNVEACFYGSGKAYLFDNLNAAIAHAQSASNKTITLAGNGTLSTGDYTIPSGVTMLVPFDAAGTCYTNNPGYSTSTYKQPTAFYTMTMASGAHITVNGAISVSANVNAVQGTTGAPDTSYGHIAMNSGSTITVNSGANLYVWGYISGAGTVTVKSGGTVHESFQVMDWRGGTASSGMLNNSQKVFPMSQYYVQNVEALMTLEAGAKEYCSMVADIISVRQVTVNFIGSSGCMFNLTSGYVTKQYNGATDMLEVDFHGDITASEISLNLILSYGIDTSKYVLPLNSSFDMRAYSGSNVTFNQTISLHPGSKLQIDEGATVTLGSGKQVFVYDETEWKKEYYVFSNANFRPVRYAHSRVKTRTVADIVDAQVIINGTVDASAGNVYTTLGGANVISTGAGVVKTQAPSTSQTLYEAVQTGTDISYSSIPLANGAVLTNADGSTVVTSVANTYTYTGTGEDGRWVCATHTEVIDAAVAPTCTATGKTEGKHCSVCGTVTVAQTEVAALGHNLVTDAAVAPTCTETGLTEGKHCDREGCGHVEVAQTVVPATGKHVYETEVVAPTCTETGYTIYTCGTCEHSYQGDTVAATGHSYNAGVITTAPTCEGTGEKTFTCTTCGETKTEEVAALGHNMQETAAAVAPTCTADGKTAVLTCANNCGHTEGGTKVAATGHAPVTDAAVAPTCTATGLAEGSHCSVCNEVLVAQTVVDALGHTEETVHGKDATCTATGLTEGSKCSVCGETIIAQEEIPAKGHTEEILPATAPTCTETGLTEGKWCSVCGEIITARGNVPALGHTEETVPGKDATCTATGLTEGKKCSVCGKTTVEQEVIPALGHTAVSVPGKDATCTEPGLTEGSKCSACGEVLVAQSEVPQLGHTEETVPGKDPTCTETGLTEGSKCSVCGETITAQEEIPAMGHQMKDADCDTPKTCSRCGITDGEALGHSYNASWVWNGNDETGYTAATATFTCACGDSKSVTDSEIVADTVDATTSAPGSVTYTAAVTFEDEEYSAEKIVVIPKIETIDISVELVGGDKYGAVVSEPKDGWKPGSNTFQVSCTNACIVVVSYDGGSSYIRLTATATDDANTYSFTADEMDETTLIKVMLNGDVNGDGKFNVRDVAMLSRVSAGTEILEALQGVIKDTNGDGKFNVRDVARLSRASAGTEPLAW